MKDQKTDTAELKRKLLEKKRIREEQKNNEELMVNAINEDVIGGDFSFVKLGFFLKLYAAFWGAIFLVFLIVVLTQPENFISDFWVKVKIGSVVGLIGGLISLPLTNILLVFFKKAGFITKRTESSDLKKTQLKQYQIKIIVFFAAFFCFANFSNAFIGHYLAFTAEEPFVWYGQYAVYNYNACKKDKDIFFGNRHIVNQVYAFAFNPVLGEIRGVKNERIAFCKKNDKKCYNLYYDTTLTTNRLHFNIPNIVMKYAYQNTNDVGSVRMEREQAVLTGRKNPMGLIFDNIKVSRY